ncbi:MAG TPA: TetR/AcrR family transcriptional regulator [Acidimicrobiia bacterium]|nr:TetR/AcrR family transcriptional regulator [Acidimicrobiia bacterium]
MARPKSERPARPRRDGAAPARKGRPPATDSADTRRAILAAARGCFGREGYDKTTNKDIAAAAGITQAAIYHYFPSKADLFVAAYQDMQAVSFRRFEEVAAATAGGLADRIKAVLGLAAELHGADRTLAAFTAVAPIEIQRHPELRRALGDEVTVVYRFFEGLVAAAAAGDLDADVDPDSVVNLLVATSTGFATLGATARAAEIHRRAIDAFGRLVDGTLFDEAGTHRAGSRRRSRRFAGLRSAPDVTDARDRILAAARGRFGRQGYDKTTNKDIAGAVGFTAGAIYRHFPSKADLFIAVYRGLQDSVFSQFEAVISDERSAPDKIRAILDLSVELHAADRSLATFTAIAPIEIQRHPEIRRELGTDPMAVYRFFRRVMADSAPDLAADVDPDAVADMLVAVVTGFNQFGAVTRSARPHRAAIAAFERLLDGTLFPTRTAGRRRRRLDAAAG